MLPTAVTWSGTVAGTVSLGYDAAFRMDTITVNGTPIRVLSLSAATAPA